MNKVKCIKPLSPNERFTKSSIFDKILKHACLTGSGRCGIFSGFKESDVVSG